MSETPSTPQLLEPIERRPTIEGVAHEPAATDVAVGPPMCAVVGHVVDVEGRLLGNALVRASAYRSWREGVEMPRLEGRYDSRGFEVRTDASGAFRIEAPVPTAQLVGVRVSPDRFHDS